MKISEIFLFHSKILLEQELISPPFPVGFLRKLNNPPGGKSGHNNLESPLTGSHTSGRLRGMGTMLGDWDERYHSNPAGREVFGSVNNRKVCQDISGKGCRPLPQ